jgi:hypothetical protein
MRDCREVWCSRDGRSLLQSQNCQSVGLGAQISTCRKVDLVSLVLACVPASGMPESLVVCGTLVGAVGTAYLGLRIITPDNFTCSQRPFFSLEQHHPRFASSTYLHLNKILYNICAVPLSRSSLVPTLRGRSSAWIRLSPNRPK